MDDLTLIRDFRDGAALEGAARERARAALAAAIAGRHARRPRLALVAAALTILLVGGGTAYALAREFLVGDPAPADVKEQAARGPGKPLIGSPPKALAVRPEGMVLAASLESSVGTVYLWRAPSDREGTDCLFTQIVGTEQRDGSPNLGGGCSGGPGSINAAFAGSRVRDGRWLSLVYGRVDPAVRRLFVELDGQRMAIPLTDRFFLHELPGIGPDDRPALRFVGYSASGAEIAELERPAVPPPLEGCEELTGKPPVLEILTRRTRRPMRAYVLEREDEVCTRLETPGGTSSGREPLPGAREIPIGVTQIGSGERALVLISGVVGREIEQLELVFDDGRVERLPLVDHVTLYQVAPADYAAGQQPVKLVGRDRAGRVIAEQPIR